MHAGGDEKRMRKAGAAGRSHGGKDSEQNQGNGTGGTEKTTQ